MMMVNNNSRLPHAESVKDRISSSNAMKEHQHELEFEDFSDLQTRLVLLPRIEEEGIGAVVASYFPPSDDDVTVPDLTGFVLQGLVGTRKANQQLQNQQDDDNNDPTKDEPIKINIENVVQDDENDIDWTDKEFSSILASIRQAPCPIVLSLCESNHIHQQMQTTNTYKQQSKQNNHHLQHHPEPSQEEEKKMDDDRSLDTNNTQHKQQGDPQPETEYDNDDKRLTMISHDGDLDTSSQSQKHERKESASSSSFFWSKRFSETSFTQLASGAATSAAYLARAANERAAKLSSAAAAAAAAAANNNTSKEVISKQQRKQPYQSYAIYKQSSQSGEFCYRQNQTQRIVGVTSSPSLGESSSASIDNSPTTNSSLLAVRCSATQCCPAIPGQSFQWYRSTFSKAQQLTDNHSTEDGWQILHGADRPVFQPSATEVGYQLKCVIRIIEENAPDVVADSTSAKGENDDEQISNTNSLDDASDSSSVSSTSLNSLDNDDENIRNSDSCDDGVMKVKKSKKKTKVSSNNNKVTIITCELLDVVQADLSLFNGARQALVRGAQFSGLVGMGNAQGRNLSLRIRMARRKHNKGIVCAVSIYQISGDTAEPIHSDEHNKESPLICVSAVSDPSHAKQFELILATPTIHDHLSMVYALSTPFDHPTIDDDDNSIANGNNNQGILMRFQLQAPNRLARESLLLAIGIANYSGEPSSLHEAIPLYENRHVVASSIIPSSWSLTSSSDASSTHGGSTIGDFNTSILNDDDEGNDEAEASFILSTSVLTSSSIGKEPESSFIPISEVSSQHQHPSDDDENNSHQRMVVGRLEQEIQLLREKLSRKDKVVSELQRSLTQSDEYNRNIENQLKAKQDECARCIVERQVIEQDLRKADNKITEQESRIAQVMHLNQSKQEELLGTIQEQKVKIMELEKANRTLQNEKAVLSAAVEARESKLDAMAELKTSLAEANIRLSRQETIEKELDVSNKRFQEAKDDLERIRKVEKECRAELAMAQNQISELQNQLNVEMTKTSGQQSELEKEQMKIQKLKAERNSYKQKGDSLSKEIARVCRNGRTIRDVEKIIADDAARRQEVELLREQKQRALDEVQQYRILLDQSRMTQKLAGIDQDSIKLMERNTELERVLAELTEYVTAKEMQLGTMKQINDALQAEIRDLAKANMSKNDV